MIRSTVVTDPGVLPPATHPSVVIDTPDVAAYLLELKGPLDTPAAVSLAKTIFSTMLLAGASLQAYHPFAEKSCIPALSAAVVGRLPFCTPVAVSEAKMIRSVRDTLAGPGPRVPPPIHISDAKFCVYPPKVLFSDRLPLVVVVAVSLE